jgi:hypothetical protein
MSVRPFGRLPPRPRAPLNGGRATEGVDLHFVSIFGAFVLLHFFFWLGGGLSSLYFWLCCFFLYLLNQVLPAKAFTCKSIYLSIVQVLLYFFALFQASAD